MPLTRRDILLGSCLAPWLPRLGFATPQDWKALALADIAPPEIPHELNQFKSQPSLNEGVLTDYEPTGTEKPTSAENMLGQEVLKSLPSNCTPIEIALYFLAVGQGKFGMDRIPYITAWPERWNPVIVEFFRATTLQPSGDTTAWCAAFMNYCLMMSAKGKQLPANSSKPTLSAAALSFRTWGKETTTASPGDIVVFKNVTSPLGRGHVGFFLAEQGDSVLVLSGNQFEGKPVRHTINRKWLKKNGSVLKLHSYRTEEQLHV